MLFRCLMSFVERKQLVVEKTSVSVADTDKKLVPSFVLFSIHKRF